MSHYHTCSATIEAACTALGTSCPQVDLSIWLRSCREESDRPVRGQVSIPIFLLCAFVRPSVRHVFDPHLKKACVSCYSSCTVYDHAIPWHPTTRGRAPFPPGWRAGSYRTARATSPLAATHTSSLTTFPCFRNTTRKDKIKIYIYIYIYWFIFRAFNTCTRESLIPGQAPVRRLGAAPAVHRQQGRGDLLLQVQPSLQTPPILHHRVPKLFPGQNRFGQKEK